MRVSTPESPRLVPEHRSNTNPGRWSGSRARCEERKHTGEGCSVLGFTCSYVRMGGAHASSDGFTLPPPTSPGFPSKAEEEFRRTYFGSCRAGASVLLDASRARRKDCEANVLESIEVTGTNRCKHPSDSALECSSTTTLTASPPSTFLTTVERPTSPLCAYDKGNRHLPLEFSARFIIFGDESCASLVRQSRRYLTALVKMTPTPISCVAVNSSAFVRSLVFLLTRDSRSFKFERPPSVIPRRYHSARLPPLEGFDGTHWQRLRSFQERYSRV
jgi:hypothetical protein